MTLKILQLKFKAIAKKATLLSFLQERKNVDVNGKKVNVKLFGCWENASIDSQIKWKFGERCKLPSRPDVNQMEL